MKVKPFSKHADLEGREIRSSVRKAIANYLGAKLQELDIEAERQDLEYWGPDVKLIKSSRTVLLEDEWRKTWWEAPHDFPIGLLPREKGASVPARKEPNKAELYVQIRNDGLRCWVLPMEQVLMHPIEPVKASNWNEIDHFYRGIRASEVDIYEIRDGSLIPVDEKCEHRFLESVFKPHE